MAQTERLGLPLLAAGQAQKEITHNEALALVDMAVQLAVESADLAAPPTSPDYGQCWIIADGASGAWTGREGAVAAWTANGWLFLTPAPGWEAWALDRTNGIRFDGAQWIDKSVRNDGIYIAGERVVCARQSAILSPSGGATQDGEARASITAILSILRTHGLIEI